MARGSLLVFVFVAGVGGRVVLVAVGSDNEVFGKGVGAKARVCCWSTPANKAGVLAVGDDEVVFANRGGAKACVCCPAAKKEITIQHDSGRLRFRGDDDSIRVVVMVAVGKRRWTSSLLLINLLLDLCWRPAD
jgi:hypothetical protein